MRWLGNAQSWRLEVNSLTSAILDILSTPLCVQRGNMFEGWVPGFNLLHANMHITIW